MYLLTLHIKSRLNQRPGSQKTSDYHWLLDCYPSQGQGYFTPCDLIMVKGRGKITSQRMSGSTTLKIQIVIPLICWGSGNSMELIRTSYYLTGSEKFEMAAIIVAGGI